MTIPIISTLIFIFMCLYFWFTTFLWHELCHIKSQGLKITGKIYVHKYGFTVSSDKIINVDWFFFSGGFLSGLVHLIVGGLIWSYGIELWPFYVPIVTCGMVNLTYGFYEMIIGPAGRYRIYLVTIIVMLAFWLYYWRVI